MNHSDSGTIMPDSFTFAAHAERDERATFISKTYIHLAGAIAAFVAFEAVLLSLPFTPRLVETMIGGRFSWLIVLGAFMAVSWIANSWARSATSLSTQYMGLGLYVVAQAIIMVPLLYIAQRFHSGIIATAGITTLGLFAVLTTVVFVTRKDFSFLRSVLIFGGFAAFGLIACGILFNFALGPIFTYAMIALACGYILYDTSNIMLHYRTTQYVAASLALFASVALLFWYVLQLFMSRD
jgi:FtsH-binding integral membrane protein